MGEFVDVHYYRIGLKSRIEVEDWLMENLITKKEFLNDPAGFIEEHGDRSFHFQKTDKTLSDVMTRFYHRHRREMNTIAEWVSLSTKED